MSGLSIGMSPSTAERISMDPVSVTGSRAASWLRAERHLVGVAGQGAVVGERGRVIAGVSLVGAGTAGVFVGAADAGDVDDRRGRVLEGVGEAGAEGVEGRGDAPDATVRVLDPRGSEVVEPGDELGGVGAEERQVGEAVFKRAHRLAEGALGEVVIGGPGVVGVR